jgi:hypothetical protein
MNVLSGVTLGTKTKGPSQLQTRSPQTKGSHPAQFCFFAYRESVFLHLSLIFHGRRFLSTYSTITYVHAKAVAPRAATWDGAGFLVRAEAGSQFLADQRLLEFANILKAFWQGVRVQQIGRFFAESILPFMTELMVCLKECHTRTRLAKD